MRCSRSSPPACSSSAGGQSVLRAELAPRADGCTLTFSESFEDGSVAARNAAGWEWCLESLGAILRDVTPTPFKLDEWRGPFERYVAQFEPMAGAQQEPPEDHPAVIAEAEAAGDESDG